MRSSKEIIEILEQTYTERMKRSFDNWDDAERWVNRKCGNFEKIFEGICGEGMGIDVMEWGRQSVMYRIETSDKPIWFEFVMFFSDGKYECSFYWRLI
jgi:hypothetical protein